MSFTFNHSLASRAAVSVVISLWYHEDIDSLKSVNGFVGNDSRWTQSPFDLSCFRVNSAKRIHRLELHKRVTGSVSELSIPVSLKKYLLEFVQIVGENLEEWIDDHYRAPEKLIEVYGRQCFSEGFFDIATLIDGRRLDGFVESSENAAIDVDLRKVLRWSPDGEIDLEHTGEALVRNESDSIKRFRLACAYCREDEMMRLWPSLQGHFSNPEAWDTSFPYEMSALFWWRYFHTTWPESVSTYLSNLDKVACVRGRLVLIEVCYSCSSSFRNRCSPLTPYYLSKISLVNEQSWNITGKEKFLADRRHGTLFFRMPESFRVQVSIEIPESFLKQLLLWRHQSFFMDTVESSWSMLDEGLFDSILFHIALAVERYADSDIYKEIFMRYWTGSPARLRDVERIFYDREVVGGRTLRHFVGLLFGHSPTAEDRIKQDLFEGRHVLQLATRVCARDVLSDMVCTCLPPEEFGGMLELLNEHFTPDR